VTSLQPPRSKFKIRISRVASPDMPVPFTPVLENTYRLDAARIIQTVEVFQ